MRTLSLAAGLMGLVAFAGCFDLPLDRWEAQYAYGHRPRSRETRTVQAIRPSAVDAQGNAVPVYVGPTNIYYTNVSPGYCGPYTYGSPTYGYGGSRWYVSGSGSGRNYQWQGGLAGGYGPYGSYSYPYGTASGHTGNVWWNAQLNQGQGQRQHVGPRESYGIYGNGNSTQVGGQPSRFTGMVR